MNKLIRSEKPACVIFLAVITVLLVVTGVCADDVVPVRVKDIVRVQGVRDNQLYGLGLVIGLNGTGDGTGALANLQMIANMLEKFGITVSAENLRLRNVAAVMVTADIQSSVRVGDRIDVTVSSIGDAKSLQGGYLLQTPLQAANGETYAAAQGSLSIGGFVVRGGSSSVQQNHTTVAMIPNGAIVEQEIPQSIIVDEGRLNLVLKEADFSTASRLAAAINQVFSNSAYAQDQSTVAVRIPQEYYNNIVGFVAAIEELPILPDTKARVVINERTGTVVMGSDVRIATVAVAHGGLNVRVDADMQVSQPAGFVGETVTDQNYQIVVEEEPHNLMLLKGSSSVEDLIAALNAIGATPRDIIAILQAIKAAGALYGELVIM